MAAAPNRTICIAGAGISGLGLALGLAKHGAHVIVLERGDAIQEFGAGLQISPNARFALNALGLDREIEAVSFEPECIDVYPFRHRNPVVSLSLGGRVRERFGLPYALMHRVDLAKVLFENCRRFANIDIRFGIRSFDVATTARGATVTFRPEGSQAEDIRCFAFVGADGVGSRTRTALLGGGEAAYSGYVAWRTMIPTDALAPAIASGNTSLMWGPGFHAVAYSVPNRDETNVALFARERLSIGFGIRPAPRLPTVAMQDPRFQALSENAGQWTHWPMATVKTPAWHRGPVGIIGDAAHAMLPFQAQGAAMALEDAVTLAPLLVERDSADEAFSQFERLRRDRVGRVAAVSAANGRIFHMRKPFSAVRNAVIRAQGPTAHLKRLHWLYGHDPTAN